MIKCSGCGEFKHKSWFIKVMLFRASKGWATYCSPCANKIRIEKRWLKEKTTHPIRWKKQFKITSSEYAYSKEEMRVFQLAAIRSVYRIWCKTGRLIKYDYAVTRRRVIYNDIKEVKDER